MHSNRDWGSTVEVGGSMALSVVVLEGDPKLAQSLAGGLQPHFHSVHLTRSREELRDHVVKKQPQAVIVDIEAWRLTDVASLLGQIGALPALTR